ncbi:MAG: peptidylprolyl isomerase [Candidatus Uhrbacteria bacterium]|nr:peptidylprolyl isomerase [Candidatus Uhrbacteria bacterium]
MKRLSLFLSLALLLLVGSGCVKSKDASSDVTFNYPDQKPAEQTAPAPTTPGATTPTSAPLETTKPMTWTFPGKRSEKEIAHKQIRLTTDKGDIVFELFADTAPLTVSNFVYLTEGGYYNGLTFHRREEGFVIQGGDPSGNGTGGPGYKFADELADKYTYTRGIVAMANAGPATNGSQFFIMLADAPLPKAYSIFGKVTSGMDVVDKIKVGDKMTKVTVEDKK